MGDAISLLHVENDPAFADLVETYLGRTDTSFDVHHALDVDEALSMLDDRAVDCVISDHHLPGGDSLELLEAVRRRDEALPFVLFTGQGSEDVAARAIRAGASDYLQKFGGTERYEVLARRVESLVEKYETERRLRRASAGIENASDGIALFDAEGRFVYLNEAYADLYGHEPSELRGDSWGRLYPEEEVARYEERVHPALLEDGEWTGEFVGRRDDGERVRSTHSLTLLDDGSHVCVVHSGSVEQL